jgi:hypothetical protein
MFQKNEQGKTEELLYSHGNITLNDSPEDSPIPRSFLDVWLAMMSKGLVSLFV